MSDTYSKIMQDNPTYTANQAIFVYHLRQNPHGHEQIYHELDNSRGGMCALGVGMEAFGILRTWEQYKEKFPDAEMFQFGSPAYYDPYVEIAKKLGVPKEHVNEIYRLNDDDMMNFGEIADAFEAYLKTDRKVGPRSLIRNAKADENKKKFVETWTKIFAPVSDVVGRVEALQEQLEEAEEELGDVTDGVHTTLREELGVELNWYDEVGELAGMDIDEAWNMFGDIEDDD